MQHQGSAWSSTFKEQGMPYVVLREKKKKKLLRNHYRLALNHLCLSNFQALWNLDTYPGFYKKQESGEAEKKLV